MNPRADGPWTVTRPLLTMFVGAFAALAIVLAPSAAAGAKARSPQGRQGSYYVDVGVATLWASPGLDRRVDRPALSNPSDVGLWLANMGPRQEARLVGALETQALYGHEVRILKEDGGWVKVAVPGQPTPRNPLGYPGWVPRRQLTHNAGLSGYKGRPFAQVESTTAWLYDTHKLHGRFIELSSATRLPVAKRLPNAIGVATPDDGQKWLRASDVSVYPSEAAIPKPTGEQLVDSAKEFLGVPYLWAGTSGFGFDCSGLTYLVHGAHGITVPRDTLSREDLTSPPYGGRPVRNYADLKPGDLAYFAYRGGTGAVHHVGMYVGNGKMIHSPSPGGRVSIVKMERSGWIEEYAGAVRYF